MSLRSRNIGAASQRSYLGRWILVLGGAVIVFALIYAFPIGMFFAVGFPENLPPVVSSVIVQEQPWQPEVEVVGSFSASQGADLAVEVSGIVEQVYFESGGEVAAGVPLIRLRTTDETARLRTLEANAELAAATHARNQRLLEIQGISTAELETSEAALKSAQAQVAEQRAIIEKKVVRAPFAGELGIRQVNVGQYLDPGAVIATLQALDPIHFDFYVPQQTLEQLKVGQSVSISVDGYTDAAFKGDIATIDPKVDQATRNIAIRAVVANQDRRLLPGMYATANIVTGAAQDFLTVPQTAVTYNPYGNTVYRVEEVTEEGDTHLIATQTFVTTGETRGDQITILSGISPGEEIVSAGQFKLQNGMTIEINNSVQPSNDPDPRPLQR
ncbi:MAG: efflux RND transporter periplasmic adaptor subunit [Micropepsaceae bacterium]